MAYGNADKYFSGTFDGGGFTITYSASVTYDYISLFRKCDGATIKNLHVTGTLTASNRHAAGFVAHAKGNVTLINCRSSITINSSHNGDATHGGLVGLVDYSSSITLRGCVFDGKFTTTNGTTNCGGLVGWSESPLTVEDCLFAPASGNTTSMGLGTLVRVRGEIARTYTNSYYTETFGTAQGKQARTISAGTDVTALAISGTATEYGAARITTYGTNKGFKYNGTYYAGNGDEVTLTLTHADKPGYTFSQYTATPGTLSAQTETSATLNMTDANQTVSAEYTKNEVTLTDGVNLSASGLTGFVGKQCDVSYTREFTVGKTSTVCLPFAYTKQGTEGSFYEFTSITEEDGEYVATMTEPVSTTLAANTPYLFTPAVSSVTFTGTIASVPATFTAGETVKTDWTFKGTFSTINWDGTQTGTYGFSAQNVGENISQGEFVKVGEYVRIKPMRCYLEYTGSDANWAAARGMNRAAAADEPLPETIKVRLIGANGEVTAIGTLHTQTGEVVLDGWYTLDGTRLSGQPTRKGIYVNNGKKVIIK